MEARAFKNIWKLRWIIVFIIIIALFLATNASAASTSTQSQPAAGGALFIAFAIAYLSRRRAIGGWLLYFYVQLYLSLAISLFAISQVLSNLNPAQWDNSMLYVMFFLSVVPVIVTEGIEVFAATRLLFRRNERNLKYLKRTLIALVVTSGVALSIDIAFFKDEPALFLDILTFIFAIIWTLYFFKAQRIKLAFVDRNWVYKSSAERRVLLPEDKQKLRKRSIIATLVTFVLFLFMMGVSLENKKPDISIFMVPVFCAFIAAVVAWYLPIRKKKAISTQGAILESKTKQNDT
jgi:hypothetical protein